MKRVFIINGVSHSMRLLRGQGQTFAYQFSDQDGNPTLSDLTVHLSDPNEDLDIIEPAPQSPKLCVALMTSPLHTYEMFRGYLDQERSEYDKNQRTYKLTLASHETPLIAQLKMLRMEAFRDHFALFYVLPRPRLFKYVRETIAQICAGIGAVFVAAQCTIPATWIVGGANTWDVWRWPPNQTAYDFMAAVAKLHNAIWFFDAAGTLWFIDKRSWFEQQLAWGTTSLPVLKDSTVISNKRVGYDRVITEWDSTVWPVTVGFTYNAASARHKQVRIPFTMPHTIYSAFVDGNVIDFQTDFGTGNGPEVYNIVCDYLLTGPDRFIKKIDPLGTTYTIEGDGLVEFKRTYSLINLALTPFEFGRLTLGYGSVPPPMPSLGPPWKWFAREVLIDSVNETAEITAIGYDI
jgi:hypothetical protein